MSVCEVCWREAQLRQVEEPTKTVSEIYRALIDNPDRGWRLDHPVAVITPEEPTEAE